MGVGSGACGAAAHASCDRPLAVDRVLFGWLRGDGPICTPRTCKELGIRVLSSSTAFSKETMLARRRRLLGSRLLHGTATWSCGRLRRVGDGDGCAAFASSPSMAAFGDCGAWSSVAAWKVADPPAATWPRFAPRGDGVSSSSRIGAAAAGAALVPKSQLTEAFGSAPQGGSVPPAVARCAAAGFASRGGTRLPE